MQRNYFHFYIFSFFILIMFLSISSIYAVDIKDIAPEHQYYRDVQFLVNSSILPLYANKTFRLDAKLSKANLLLAAMTLSDNDIRKANPVPLSDIVKANDKLFPFVQLAIEKQFISSQEKSLTANISLDQAAIILQKVLGKADLASYSNSKDLLTRTGLIDMLKKCEVYIKKLALDAENKDNYLDNSINLFIKGDKKALDRIEVTKYQLKNTEMESAYWEGSTTEDIQYQAINDDMSSESLDVLSKHLNQALLNFYAMQYWLTIDECNAVLHVKPDHVWALSLKGSAYYMLFDYEKAKKYWKRALLNDPNNKEIVSALMNMPK